ncbi:MAG: ArnT family glycosyltransferase [Acidimicrobiales bacterium]
MVGATPDTAAPPEGVAAGAPEDSPPEGHQDEPQRWSPRLDLWRSPPDQPAWARPALLLVTALAALAYSWRIGSTIEIYYAAAVRSMSHSWHDTVFGAFDPAGTITVDKLPGALWAQALSVRLFGFHVWSIMLPQAVEGALTVLVLYHAVRRLAGPLAGIVAAVVLAASPATMTLDRGNVPDSLMVLLVVLAADSTVTAILTGRWRSAVMAGVWVSLAFQAKMIEAWLVLPALGLAYLVAARGDLAARLARLAAMAAVTVVVSLSYMSFVALTPASERPYVDGSTTNSIFHQVFVYNGFSRLGQASPNQLLGQTLGTPLFSLGEPAATWDRLFTGAYGRDTGWLLPAALLVALAVLVARRRRPRTDLPRAGVLLWGTWLVTLGVVFTVSTTMNSYYAGALSPPVAGLLGIGGALAWERRRERATQAVTAGIVVVTVGYGAWLLPGQGTGLPPWLATATVLAGGAAVVLLALLWVARWPGREGSDGDGAGARRRTVVVLLAALFSAVALLFIPVAASASVVAESLGAFDTPFQPQGVTTFVHSVFAPQPSPPDLATIESVRRGAPYLMATQTSAVAAPYIYATGEEVLPLGGYTGTTPAPSVAQTRSMIARGLFHLALIATPTATPSARFIAAHCLHVQKRGTAAAPKLRVYYCLG